MEQILYDQVVAPVVKFMASHITKHLGYVFCSTKHVTGMKDKLKDLVDTSTEVIEHKNRNETNDKEIPARVEAWLGDVEKVKDQVQSIPNDDIGCLHMKNRYRVGRNASKATMRIQELISKYSEFTWTDAPLPTGRATSSTTSTPLSSSPGGDDFKSRDVPFNDALRLLQQDDNKSQVIALCGMGGVGKTTMMEQLKKVAEDKKMFDFFVKVTIGRNPNMFSIQNDIAICIGGESLREATVTARADTLQRKFKRKLEEDKKKILVILDDVWEKVEIKDFGLTSPLPKGVKLLLTSRDSKVCTLIADTSLLQVVRVNVLSDAEAQNFLSKYTGVSIEHDQDQFQIGCDIVKKCGNLPLAIKLIGTTLKSQETYVWRDTLNRLKNHDLDDNVQEIIRISYEYVKKDEDKEIFLHCGLFPEDTDIQIEDLVRHAWGLKLFKNFSTLREARDRTNTCVRNLVNANLLMDSEELGCVKMHDLVLAFVLERVSKGDFAWIVNHGDVSSWDRDEMNESCKRMSLTCMGMSEFPLDFKYPDLSFIQLMDGDQSLKFPEDLYASMENLKVIAFYKMQYPPLPTSLQFSTNLKSLCLHNCELMSDWSFIGDLVNLEVLSLAYCDINKLSSKIGNLGKLKLLDLTGCAYLHIDDGVFINLVKLEELYMRGLYRGGIDFTDANLEELKKLSCQLCALEVQFSLMNDLKDLSFEKLDKFKISIGGRNFEFERDISFKTTLQLNLLADHRSGLVDYKIHELVKKSESLFLSMYHMSHLEDFVPVNPYDQSFFLYLRDFHVDGCGNLKYLFPTHVTRGLRKLERLTIRSCSVLEAVVHDYNGEINGKGEMIIFEELKYLYLDGLPKLVRLFPVDSVVELPQLVELEVDDLPSITSVYPDNKNTSAWQQALFNSQVRTSEMKKVVIKSMDNLERIWPSSSEEEFDNIPMLRDVRVEECYKLENLFPTNPMRLLKHLEQITISECNSLREIFNIDLECFGEIEQVINISLRYISVRGFLRECHVWSINGGERNSSFHDFDTYSTYEQTSHQPSPNSIRLRRERGNLGEASSGQAGADTRMKGKL
ncbi:putative P-loop containing nucleoside triphosphate hydrolase, leucine-rich repeat domain superfamily [Helianthus annuus]|uniref:P-loop containing nucleoside triphosphate hydrolase, leucine-rich repeat domain superfamily n=2 Tax=Helianthus annuus TaxID=4232 RepID=A0A9K3JRL2_HELAN|nr:probable disease resistance protein At4g27220 isoform X1 [Helianthus annuus]KAF5819991.1 putative P-loop containing nucleoside triphosphate hydrolase, leucine-rich repeat domain superfamily [Helianthus annuus]KAJ0606074.1 putative P-loop containing nucleoside triphosphate hydrolase, leucine-rich repeat domain superfamily [Helianthus annuus]KAJ0620082.1 putative P-loop containing nucleoside triphosphate hydrolase, leucine-rich repeat domain superfamily [Helianthus annuus]KAJ0778539.1 putative